MHQSKQENKLGEWKSNWIKGRVEQREFQGIMMSERVKGVSFEAGEFKKQINRKYGDINERMRGWVTKQN